MAVTVETSPVFIQANTYSAELARRGTFGWDLQRGSSIGSVSGGLVGALSGIPDINVTWSGTGLTCNISAGEVIVPGSSSLTQSGYYLRVTTAGSLTPTTANPSNPRIDLIYAQVVDAAYVGGSSNLGQVAIAPGTPTAGATLANLTGAPALPTSSIAIAYVLIPAAATTISNSDIQNETATTNSAGGYIMAYSGPNIFHRRNVSGASTVTANSGDHLIVSSGNTPITLPAPFPNARVKVTNYGSGVPVVSHNASEVIYGLNQGVSGSSSFKLTQVGTTATVESDGTNWYITAQNFQNPQIIASFTYVGAASGSVILIAGSSYTVASSVGTWTTGANGFLVPSPGLYAVSSGAQLTTNTIMENTGVTLTGTLVQPSFNSNPADVTNGAATVLVRCAATDYLSTQFEHFLGTAQTVQVQFQAVKVSD